MPRPVGGCRGFMIAFHDTPSLVAGARIHCNETRPPWKGAAPRTLFADPAVENPIEKAAGPRKRRDGSGAIPTHLAATTSGAGGDLRREERRGPRAVGRCRR